MYQLATKWKLWELPEHLRKEVSEITIRGYSEAPPVALEADFFPLKRPLSVEQIGSGYCPTGRDIYFDVYSSARSDKTWGRVAGVLVHDFCLGLFDHFAELAKAPKGLTYDKISKLANSYATEFWAKPSRGKALKSLDKKARGAEDNSQRLVFLLQQTAKYELSLLGADYAFSKQFFRRFIPVTQSIPVALSKEQLSINPHARLGLGKVSTPDFMMAAPSPVIGEVKTGRSLRDFHLTTVAGYALAYESQHNQDVDFGILYFLETHSTQLSFAGSRPFVIDDLLRKQFLKKRNDLYAILAKGDEPSLADPKYYEDFCFHCKYHAHCYPE